MAYASILCADIDSWQDGEVFAMRVLDAMTHEGRKCVGQWSRTAFVSFCVAHFAKSNRAITYTEVAKAWEDAHVKRINGNLEFEDTPTQVGPFTSPYATGYYERVLSTLGLKRNVR